jgi:integrase
VARSRGRFLLEAPAQPHDFDREICSRPQLLRKTGLPPMRLYDIRHSFATPWIESGESAEILQKVLGHPSIATTINTYSHLSPRYQRESFGRFLQRQRRS